MLKIFGLFLLLGIIFAIAKYFLVFFIRITAIGIAAFFAVGAVTGLLALFGIISSDTAWVITGIAFFIGVAYNLYEFFANPREVMSDVKRMYHDHSGSYTPSSTTSDDGETSGYGFNCCDNCKWNQDRGSHYARCFQDGRDDHSDNDRCGLWQHY